MAITDQQRAEAFLTAILLYIFATIMYGFAADDKHVTFFLLGTGAMLLSIPGFRASFHR